MTTGRAEWSSGGTRRGESDDDAGETKTKLEKVN